ncbi:sensor histidine kinase [Tepidamorphus sp. 3E244]|uniref:sensor histidine kinase n=1 Tax=Tepidamorphus sp. 3E244 TaxID=3385498 RepID=UPI0038FC5EED
MPDNVHIADDNDTGLVEPRAPRGLGLSAKLLGLTILFVMLSEVLIFVPSIANFRLNWLDDRLNQAKLAANVFDAAPDGMVPEDLQREILASLDGLTLALKHDGMRQLLAVSDMPANVDKDVDMSGYNVLPAIMEAIETLMAPPGRILRVTGDTREGEMVELVIAEAPLRRAMFRYAANILTLSILISVVTAALVYLSLNALLVRPMRRLTRKMVAFSENPEDGRNIIRPSGRRDEVGIAERELEAMQRQIAGTLQQKNRLAALGLAVSKINHDLRNLLSSAQLIGDRVGAVEDPTVQRFAPRLIATLDRAVAFCTNTLKYGRAHEEPPEPQVFRLRALVDEVFETLSLGEGEDVSFRNDVEAGFVVDADRDQLFRVLINLGRNARQALVGRGEIDADADYVRFAASRSGDTVTVLVEDTGPGVPPRARENLFQAFKGSSRAGGTGLGLAIAAELVRAHGGELRLLDVGEGATFAFTLPQQPATRPRGNVRQVSGARESEPAARNPSR